MNTWSPFAHKLFRQWRALRLPAGAYGVAVSGGGDSVALLHALAEIAKGARLELHVLHVHHGGDAPARAEAQRFTAELARDLRLKYHLAEAGSRLESEAEMRAFRRESLLAFREELGLRGLLTAHHADDLLETRLLRLIRGTGAQGLPAIRTKRGVWIRPLLHLPQRELRAYLSEQRLKHLEDPSNRDERYLRNWLRHAWLPLLDAKRPGSVARLGHSLELLVESLALRQAKSTGPSAAELWLSPRRLSRLHYKKLSGMAQKQTLATWLKKLGVQNYSAKGLEEIRKQLDIPKSEHTFTVSGVRFVTNAKQIEAVVAKRERRAGKKLG